MPRLLVELRTVIRTKRYCPRTERAYVAWVVRFVRHCGLRHPRECGEREVAQFLQALAVRGKLGASAQIQARAALGFLYRDVLQLPLTRFSAAVKPKRGRRMPSVLEPPDVERVLAKLSPPALTIVQLLYGAGLRLNEALTLRVRDVDVSRRVIVVGGGRGSKVRRTMLPASLVSSMGEYLMVRRQQHLRAVAMGGGHYPLSDAVDRKMTGTVSDWRWAWLFPARRDVWDRTGKCRVRFPVHATTIQRAISRAATRAGVDKRVTAHTFRHSFATQLLRSGYDIRTVQALLGHADVSTTMIYLHVLRKGTGVRSPLDRLSAGLG